MNIDISNAHCGPRIQFPDHAWLRVVSVPRNCLRARASSRRAARTSDVGRSPRLRARNSPRGVWSYRVTTEESVSPPWASSEMKRRRARVRRRGVPAKEKARHGTCARPENERKKAAPAASLIPSSFPSSYLRERHTSARVVS